MDVNGARPARVTTDHHAAYPKAIRLVAGRKGLHRRDQYLNNRTEQDHRGIKQRYYPMLGFGSFLAAARFCEAFDALRQYFRARHHCGENVPLRVQRRQFLERWHALVAEMSAA